MSILTGRSSHPTILLWLALFSFFYFRWLFWSSAAGLSVDGIYFGGLLFVCSVYLIYFQSHHRYTIDTGLLVHFAVILLSGLTVLWSSGKIAGLRELAALLYGWMFHFLFRNVHYSKAARVYKSLLAILVLYLAATVVSVSLGWAAGIFTFAPDEQGEIGDVAGYFFMPIDLVSAITFMALSLIGIGERRYFCVISLLSSSCLLVLNFSKTYMVASVAAWVGYWLLRKGSKSAAFGIFCVAAACTVALLFTSNPFSRQFFFDKDMTLAMFLSSPHFYFYALDTSGRLSIWTYLLIEAFTIHGGPLFGGGIGTTREILSQNPFGAAGLAAHSDYVKLLADFGIIGAGLYLCLLFAIGRRFARLMKCTGDKAAEAINATGLMLTIYIGVGGLGYEMLNRPRTILFVYFAIMGLSSVLEKRELKRSELSSGLALANR